MVRKTQDNNNVMKIIHHIQTTSLSHIHLDSVCSHRVNTHHLTLVHDMDKVFKSLVVTCKAVFDKTHLNKVANVTHYDTVSNVHQTTCLILFILVQIDHYQLINLHCYYQTSDYSFFYNKNFYNF